ncbi:Fluconazole resistance protein 1 [Kluyveromyces marxianus]|nr:Fluconazole resistance protein 1 [Kluyveromyces marxianus]
MMSNSSSTDTGGNTQSVKRRVSKACDACRKSKTKCDGERPCSRCLKENKLCTYSKSNIGYAQAKCKKLYNQEYVDLLETRNSLLTKALSLLFKQFDKCVDSGLVQIHPQKYTDFKHLQMQSMMLNNNSSESNPNDSNSDAWEQTDMHDQDQDAAIRDDPALAWINLLKNRNLFINGETGKLNVNEVIYSIIPTNVDMAVKSLNYTHGGKEEIDKMVMRGDPNIGKSSSQVYDKLLSRGYVNSGTLFTADHSKEGVPEDSRVELPKRKRRKNPTNQSPHGIPMSTKPSNDSTATISHNDLSSASSFPTDREQWYPKLEYSQFDLLDSLSNDFQRQHSANVRISHQHGAGQIQNQHNDGTSTVTGNTVAAQNAYQEPNEIQENKSHIRNPNPYGRNNDQYNF